MSTLDRTKSGFRFDTIASIRAGGNLYHIIPEDARFQVTSINFTLTTDDNVADRRVVVQASDGSNTFGNSPAPGNQTATQVCSYQFALCVLGIDQLTDFGTMWAPLGSNLILDPDTHIETNIIGIQVGDVISQVAIRYEHAFRVPRS